MCAAITLGYQHMQLCLENHTIWVLGVMQVCHARNVHGRSLEDIKAALQATDPIPMLYPQLDGSSLLHSSQPKHKQVIISS